MLLVSYCCCGCGLDDGTKKIGWYMVVSGLLAAIIDMFKLAILIKDPELTHTKHPPELLSHLGRDDVLEMKKLALIALLAVECTLLLCGLLLVCAVNCRSACLVSLVFLYLVLDTLVIGAQFVLLVYDPSLIYPISAPEENASRSSSFFHMCHGFLVIVQYLLQCYFCFVVLSYLCKTYCLREHRS